MKHSRRKGFRVIRDRLSYGGKTLFEISHRERKRGRDLTWTLRGMPAPEWVAENWPGSATILAVRCKGKRDGKPVDETRYYVTSLRTTAKALLQARERPLVDRELLALAPRYPAQGRRPPLPRAERRADPGNAAQPGHIDAVGRRPYALRLDGFWSITEGLAALAHDIPDLLALLGWREPAQALSSA